MQVGTRLARATLLFIGLLAAAALAPSAASAGFGIERWEALTCSVDASPADPCTSADTEDLYTQAAGHPPFGITDFRLNTGEFEVPEGNVKDVRIELPEGLGVNPEATEQCTVAEVPTAATDCPGALIGVDYLRAIVSEGPPPVASTIPVSVYNVEPPFGVPAMAGFQLPLPGATPTLLVADLDPSDQHISFTIGDIGAPPEGPPLIGSRLVFDGRAGDGYLTMPSYCDGGLTTVLRVDSHQSPGDFVSEPFTTPTGADGCDQVPFDPTIAVDAGQRVDSPEPVAVDLRIPFNPDPTAIADSHLRIAKLTLPEGLGLNPSGAAGLLACTDTEFGRGTDAPIGCPPASRIGSVEVQTPSLPPDSIGGEVYVGRPLSDDASTGEQFRIFVHAHSERYGVDLRLLGRIFPNPRTGRLTAVIADNPQAPFSSFKLKIDGGPGGLLTTPPTCGPHRTTAELTPWSGNEPATPEDALELSAAPGGGPCPKTLATRPFEPAYHAEPNQRRAGAYSPFSFHVSRPDGAQEIRRVDLTLPPGMIGRLRGVSYCPDSTIAATRFRSGRSVLADSPCPRDSGLGTVDIAAGSGSQPLLVHGGVYLAGPYGDAPVSVVFVIPAVAGPYDLGTVVVRAQLRIDPETAQVSVVSDPLPDVFGGVRLDIRRVDVSLDRARFMVNPTTCRQPFPIVSQIFGGGADPATPATWPAVTRWTQFRANDCGSLRFEPKFYARVFGGRHQMRRTANPKFRAILKARKGDANLARAAFVLPKAIILDQGHIRTICTRVQLAAQACPRGSIYGHAKITTPLLDEPLKGRVYLTSSSHRLPDLLVDLHGQIDIRLRGTISSTGGRMKTVFHPTPDVAVRKFILVMKGGGRGLLVNSKDLCGRKRFGYLNLLAQNSRRMKKRHLRVNRPGCRGGGRRY